MEKVEPASTSQQVESKSLPPTIDLLELVWRRKFAICLGIVFGIASGLLYYVLVPRTYESNAEVLVVQKRPEVITADDQYDSHFESYVATHRAVIASRLIVERAIEASGLRSLKTFSDLEEDDDLAEGIIGQLEVGRGSRDLGDNADSIMTLAIRCGEAEECPLVIEAVLDSYKAFLDETYRGMSDDAVGLMSQARDLLKNDLQQQEDAYSQFRQQSPLVTRGSEQVNPLQDRLTAIETKRSEILLRRSEIESQLMAIRKAQQDGYDPQEMLAMVTELRLRSTTDGALGNASTPLETQLFALVDEEHKLLEHYGPKHPHLVTIRQRIAAARQFLALPSTAQVHHPESAPVTDDGRAEMDPIELYTRHLERELEGLRISEKLLTGLYEIAHEKAKELAGFQLKDEQFQRNIDRTQQLYDGVIAQLQDASLVKDYGGFEARVIARPQVGRKVWPSGRLVLPISLFLGSLFGLFLGMVAELSDKRFHSRQQIQAELKLPVVGQISRFAAATESERRAFDGGNALDPLLCSCLQPRSMQAEAYRAVRNRLYVGHGRAS
ncbi:MAG: Wzz/FepE/Etk N-terminal domain-containing protein, partial [Planctomycetota bacterium]|nr:Wzz/FepE/Etk N-terminal domain-containing protein [Planctomycetota bacterium]